MSTADVPRVISQAELVAEMRRRFGDDAKKWRFKCVRCGQPQTVEAFLAAGVKEPERYIGFSCIGRFVKGVGCDWTLGGLFKIHKLEIEMPDGTRSPAFEIDDEPLEAAHG